MLISLPYVQNCAWCYKIYNQGITDCFNSKKSIIKDIDMNY